MIRLIILILLILFIVKYISDISNKLSYKFSANFLGLEKNIASVSYVLNIVNKTFLSVSLSNLYVELYYKGTLIGKTPASSVSAKLQTIKSNGESSPIGGTLDLFLGGAIVNILIEYQLYKQVSLDYAIKAKLFGIIPIKHKDKYIYKQQ